MSKTSEVRYRAWDKKLNKMRTVQTLSFDKKYVVCKDNPTEEVSFTDIELMKHMGIAGENRKGIYEGDIVSFREGDDTHIGVVMRTEEGEWFLQVTKTAQKFPFLGMRGGRLMFSAIDLRMTITFLMSIQEWFI